jgi:dTDP-4-dehydrorhamnose 3,5-epimerase
VLSADNHKTFLIPDGFAHGFQTLTENCELLYFHTAPYEPASEGGLNACDPTLNITWPLPVTELSARDAAHPWLTPASTGCAI